MSHGGGQEPTLTTGQRLLLLRESFEWTLVAAALRANLSTAALAALERGDRQPTTAQLIRLGHAYGVSSSFLQGGDGTIGLDAEPGWLVLRRKLEALSPRKRRELLAIFIQSFVVAERSLTP